jgi:hypothetical protein
MFSRLVATAATVTATTAFTMFVIMVVTVATTATIVAVIVMMVVLAVNVAMSQFFSSCFTDCDNFYVEAQVLTCQHVIAIDNNVLIFNRSNFNWHWALVGICHKAHTHFQLVNAHEDVFRYALNQILVVLAVSVICANVHVETIANYVAFQRCF